MNTNYEIEARDRWGNTDAYREHTAKTKSYTKEKWAEVNRGLMNIFAELAVCRKEGCEPDCDKAQAIVSKLQEYMTENFYTCTKEILYGLGQMYIGDERFKENIDKQGEGTAEYAAAAITFYCN